MNFSPGRNLPSSWSRIPAHFVSRYTAQSKTLSVRVTASISIILCGFVPMNICIKVLQQIIFFINCYWLYCLEIPNLKRTPAWKSSTCGDPGLKNPSTWLQEASPSEPASAASGTTINYKTLHLASRGHSKVRWNCLKMLFNRLQIKSE